MRQPSCDIFIVKIEIDTDCRAVPLRQLYFFIVNASQHEMDGWCHNSSSHMQAEKNKSEVCNLVYVGAKSTCIINLYSVSSVVMFAWFETSRFTSKTFG